MAVLRTEAEVEQIKDVCKDSLWALCTSFLGYKDWDKVHDDVERLLRRPARKKALLLPRGHLKTSFVTIAYTIQCILKNPNVRILIGNGVWDISRSFLSEIKAQLEASQLKYLFGEFASARWNADEIIVKQRSKPLKEPTVRTTGVEAEQTGGHYDVIILDDLIGLQNSSTPEQREKAKRFRRSMINLLEPGGLLIEIGTRWHLDDTFSEIFEREKRYYEILIKKIVENGKLIFPKHFSKRFDPAKKCWSSTYAATVENEKGERTVVEKFDASGEMEAEEIAKKKYGKTAGIEFAGDPTCMDYVDHLKASMPLDEFSAQYLNEPFSAENQLFKPEMFRYWNQRPEGLYVGMAVDLAISEARTADQTAIVVMGMDHEWKLYVLDYLQGRWKPADLINNVFSMRDKWKPFAVGMETNGFQRTLKIACEEEMRKRHSYFPIEEIRTASAGAGTGAGYAKEARIKSLEPFYRNGAVQHAAWMKGKDMEVQLQTFPKGKHDDVIDAMSMCLPLLHPGTEKVMSRVDDWDRAVQMAHMNNRRFQGFFEYGR